MTYALCVVYASNRDTYTWLSRDVMSFSLPINLLMGFVCFFSISQFIILSVRCKIRKKTSIKNLKTLILQWYKIGKSTKWKLQQLGHYLTVLAICNNPLTVFLSRNSNHSEFPASPMWGFTASLCFIFQTEYLWVLSCQSDKTTHFKMLLCTD